jgi:hypothetical protein
MPGSAISLAGFRPAALVQNRLLHAAIGLRQKKWQISKVPCAQDQQKLWYKDWLDFIGLQQNIIKKQ